jgi:dTMP kinase
MLLAVEGVDGSGKTTQVKLLDAALQARGLTTFPVSFPRYGDSVFGELIRRFLQGDSGDVDAVDPYLVALMFAADRSSEAPRLREALDEGRVVICDRYFYSNLAYQGAKLSGAAEVEHFGQWLRELEYGRWAIPQPTLSIYLDVHQDERGARLASRNASGGNETGSVPNDIHERDVSLQARVERFFRATAATADDLVLVECQQQGERLSAQDVTARIIGVLTERGLLCAPAQSPVPPS